MKIYLRFLIITIGFLLVSKFNCFATNGCLYTQSGNLYIENGGGNIYNYYEESDRITNAANTYCLRTIGACQIRQRTAVYNWYGGFVRYDYTLTNATLVDYGPLPCPIDDYIPYSLLGVSAFGFLFIRKRLLGKPAVKF
ncbi:MAG: hypothetical protein EOO87_12435 [Pedobacter sp.]|nr:MAG: hypothetical protein EOO87_12435 [Pedobacter sp.]